MTRTLSDYARGHVEHIERLLAEDVEGPAIRAALERLVNASGTVNGSGPASAATTWQPIDLAAILTAIESGEQAGPVPALMPRTDGLALLYPGEVHSIAGEPEAGKGWIALAESARVLADGGRVLYLDFEDAPANIAARLLALGAGAQEILERFRYVRPDESPDREAIAQLAASGCTLAVIDGQTDAYGLLGLELTNEGASDFLRRLVRPIAKSGAAVLLIDHVVKDQRNRGRFAIGGQHKLAGVAVAYGIEVIDRPSRTHTGRTKLVLQKDRHGHIPGGHGAPVALVTITPDQGGASVTVTLEPPDGVDMQGGFRPTVLMERVSRYVEANPDASLRAIREGVKGKATAKDAALELLVIEGWMTRETAGRQKSHNVQRAYREADDPTVSHRVLDTDGTRDTPTVSRVPPLQGRGTNAATPEPAVLGPFDPWTEEAA